MYVETHEKCGVCGSKDVETYHRSFISGIRCLSCGRDVIRENRSAAKTANDKNFGWTSDNTGGTF